MLREKSTYMHNDFPLFDFGCPLKGKKHGYLGTFRQEQPDIQRYF